MIFNNLISAKSISSNCEQDASFALLNNIDDLILQHTNRANTETINAQTNDFYVDVICDPEPTKIELNFFETESLKYASTVTCSKVVDRNSCENCESTLQIYSDFNDKIIGRKENVPNLMFPSASFIKVFEKVFEFAVQIIPSFVSEKSIKKILIAEVMKRYEEEIITKNIIKLTALGCVEHNEQVINDLFEMTINDALNAFCKNINGFLTGKINDLPPDPNAIQDLARTFWLSKSHIGKHSDIFKT